MSKTEGLVFEGYSPRAPIGAAAPAASLPDMSRWGNNGAFVGTAAWTQEPSGQWVYTLDGNSDYINLGTDNSLILGDCTLKSWVNLTAYQAGEMAVISASSSNAYGFGVEQTGLLYIIKVGINKKNSALTVSLATWHFVAISYNKTTNIPLFCVDGSFEIGTAWTFDATAPTNYIGADRGTVAKRLNGKGARPLIATYCMSQGELSKLFAAERTLFGV